MLDYFLTLFFPTISEKCKRLESEFKAYYVAKNKLNEKEIVAHLNNKLPAYMIPNSLLCLEKLPLTINGKLDRKALPEPEFVNKEKYTAPQDQLETELSEIWQEVLGIPSLGVTDNFFKLGGHSLLAIKLIFTFFYFRRMTTRYDFSL